jgi:hypothetical protein
MDAVPAAHKLHANRICPGTELNVPMGQGRHASTVDCSSKSLYVPAGQGTLEPSPEQYEPVGQLKHAVMRPPASSTRTSLL